MKLEESVLDASCLLITDLLPVCAQSGASALRVCHYCRLTAADQCPHESSETTQPSTPKGGKNARLNSPCPVHPARPPSRSSLCDSGLRQRQAVPQRRHSTSLADDVVSNDDESESSGDDAKRGNADLIAKGLIILFAALLATLCLIYLNPLLHSEREAERLHRARLRDCTETCKLEVVESIPENLTFARGPIPRSTFDAWRDILRRAQHEIDIAAYKSSLRGKHVLQEASPSSVPGEKIFNDLVRASKERGVHIRMVENYPPKDQGDNEDGKSLERRGVITRRPLNFAQVFGVGAMHSKFIMVDQAHMYLGSANLDWRSLNQKLELGVLILDCPCLGQDLRKLFEIYWQLTHLQNLTARSTVVIGSQAHGQQLEHLVKETGTRINMENPLQIRVGGVLTDAYLASSPRHLNGPGRSWDLDAILALINNANDYLYIHVMDYIPMLVYREKKQHWPLIDNAIRRAALERGVRVRLLAAALHFVPDILHFLKSLEAVSHAAYPGSIEVKIFKVPVMTEFHSMIARERRTHNKFVVSEDAVIIGTSNWSGDYFEGTTGTALVLNQTSVAKKSIVDQMNDIFIRDWDSPYAHPLDLYMKLCIDPERPLDEHVCETVKSRATLDKSLPF